VHALNVGRLARFQARTLPTSNLANLVPTENEVELASKAPARNARGLAVNFSRGGCWRSPDLAGGHKCGGQREVD
jgi:hypothetical protein